MKKLFFLTLIITYITFAYSVQTEKETKKNDIKVVVLIIASDDMPVYQELAKIWKSYMHLDPEHFECYFIRGNPDLSSRTQIVEDIIWCKTTENVIPGIINKTVLAIQALLPRLTEFDYLLRTNLSSFYVFPRLLECIRNLPREKCYAGHCGIKKIPFVSGSGFVLSQDLVKRIAEEENALYGDKSDYDDVLIGQFLYARQIKGINLPREDILNWKQWCRKKRKLDKGFHFRVKNDDSALRERVDSYIHQCLRDFFY